MDVQASPAVLPELKEFLGAFQGRFRRPEGAEALERYPTGLLTELPHKTCDTMAQAVPGTSAQRLQEFLTNMPWDEDDLNRQRVHKMIAEATRGDGLLVRDDTGFPKPGTPSVGVARQYSGTLGKVGNCQVAVTCCYSALQASWPVGVRLYLPQPWTDDPERCRKVRVPPEVTFLTKPAIALRLLDQARAWGVPHRCVVADADYGDHPNFLAGLEERHEPYVVGVASGLPGGRHAEDDKPPAAGGPGTPGAASAAGADHPLAPWEERVAAQEVCGGALLANHRRGREVGWLVAGGARHTRPAGGSQGLLEQPAGCCHAARAGRLCASPLCGRAVPGGGQGRAGLGPLPRPLVGWLPPARDHRHAGLQLPGVAGAAPTTCATRPGSPTRPFCPLDRTGGGIPYQRCIERSPAGYATRPCNGG
jgi:DDE superfamily endonuclease